MPDFSAYRNSKKLLERAAFYAANNSWAEADLFEQAQRDADALLALARKQEEERYA